MLETFTIFIFTGMGPDFTKDFFVVTIVIVMTTTTIHTFFTKNITKAMQAMLVSILAISVLISPAASAETRAEYTINANESKTIFVYVKYGSDTSTTNITNVATSAVINNPTDSNVKPSFIFDKNANQDVFYGDPANQNDTPQSPRECDSFVNGAPQNVRYQIPSTFVTDSKINNYGLQTAKNGAQDKATLVKGRTGCLVLALKLAPGAKVDDRAQLIVNLDANSSSDYNQDTKPEIVTVPLRVIAANNVSTTPAISSVASTAKSSTSATVSSVVPIASSSPTTRTGGLDIVVPLGVIASLVLGFFSLRKLSTNKLKIK